MKDIRRQIERQTGEVDALDAPAPESAVHP
jgi:hypothetical protein